MAKINSKLFAAIENKTGLSKPQVYKRISQVAKDDFLPRPLAAIKLAADVGVTINRYASPDELSPLRQAGTPLSRHPQREDCRSHQRRRAEGQVDRQGSERGKEVADGRYWGLVYGRDRPLRTAMFTFLAQDRRETDRMELGTSNE